MKLIRENINEKFHEESDPIQDMGIGLYTRRNFSSFNEFHKWLYKYAPIILKINNISDIIDKTASCSLVPEYYDAILNFARKYITINKQPIDNKIEVVDFRRLIQSKKKTKIHERFEEDSDPIRDIGIGATVEYIHECIRQLSILDTKQKNIFDYWVINGVKDNRFFVISTRYNTKISEPDLIKYSTKLLKQSGLIHFLEMPNVSSGAWKIKKQFIKQFDKIHLLENVNEKFEEDSDPIHDLGIGNIDIKFEDVIQPILNNYKIKKNNNNNTYLKKKYFFKVKAVIEPLIKGRYVRGEMWEVGGGRWKDSQFTIKVTKILSPGTIFEDKPGLGLLYFYVGASNGKKYCLYLKKNYFVSSSYDGRLYETFQEDTDPIRDMGIGVSHMFPEIIKDIFKYDKEKIIYTISFRNLPNTKYALKQDITIHLNHPKINNYQHLHTNEATKKYIENVLNPYKEIFKRVILEGRYRFRIVDPDEDAVLLREVPNIYVEINPNIDIKIQTIVAQRMGKDSDEISVIKM